MDFAKRIQMNNKFTKLILSPICDLYMYLRLVVLCVHVPQVGGIVCTCNRLVVLKHTMQISHTFLIYVQLLA